MLTDTAFINVLIRLTGAVTVVAFVLAVGWAIARIGLIRVRGITPDHYLPDSGTRCLAKVLSRTFPLLLRSSIALFFLLGPQMIDHSWHPLFREYSTGSVERTTIVLHDGSIAHLNTRSRLNWIGVGKERRVAVTEGEVVFDVVHDPAHPFTVVAGDSEIFDVATEFDVNIKLNGYVVVTVIKGKVVVKSRSDNGRRSTWSERALKNDEQVEYSAAGIINDVHPVSASKIVLWREGILDFDGQSLAVLIGELNRYSPKPILISDPRIMDIKMGGSFGVADIATVLEEIQHVLPVEVIDTGESYVVRYKPPNPFIPDRRARPGNDFPLAQTFYPAEAKRLGERGSVNVHVCIDPKGRLTEAPTVDHSSGSTRLDEAAIKLAEAGSGYYEPAIINGRAAESCTEFRVGFEIND